MICRKSISRFFLYSCAQGKKAKRSKKENWLDKRSCKKERKKKEYLKRKVEDWGQKWPIQGRAPQTVHRISYLTECSTCVCALLFKLRIMATLLCFLCLTSETVSLQRAHSFYWILYMRRAHNAFYAACRLHLKMQPTLIIM